MTTATDTEKLIYFRPFFGLQAELLTESDVKRIHRVWGDNQPYNKIAALAEDHNYGSGLPSVTEIMATIQCDRRLNERQAEIEARIKKGLTRSKGRQFEYVEQKLVWDLIEDAKALFIKENFETSRHVTMREKLFGEQEPSTSDHNLPYKEFFRLFGLPYKSVMDKVKECEEKVGEISKPEKFHDINFKWPVSYDGDQQSVFKHYYVKGDLSKKGEFIKTGLPYACKVYQGYSMDYIQIYVYDFHGRNWALQNVVNYLLENNLIELK